MKGFENKIINMKEKESEIFPMVNLIKRKNKISKEDEFLKLNKDTAQEILRNKTWRGYKIIKNLSKNIH